MVPGTTGDVIAEIVSMAKAKNVVVESVPRDHLDRMVRGGNHQGVAAQAGATSYVELEDFLKDLPEDKPLVVVGLDEIEDPQNLGAILRNAGFFGVAAVLVPRWRSAPVVVMHCFTSVFGCRGTSFHHQGAQPGRCDRTTQGRPV